MPRACNKNPEEKLRIKAKNRLEALDYTPMVANFLAGILRELSSRSEEQQIIMLMAFREIVKWKVTI